MKNDTASMRKAVRLMLLLRDLADSEMGMTQLANETGLSRETLYRTLSERGNPRLETLVKILSVLGLELTVQSRR